MHDIDIEQPFKIGIDFIEFDDRLYSLHTRIKFSVSSFNGQFIDIQNFAWVGFKVWDDFVLQVFEIKRGNMQPAKLFTLSDETILEVFNREHKAILAAYYNRSSASGISIQSSIEAEIGIEELDILFERFNSFAKWW